MRLDRELAAARRAVAEAGNILRKYFGEPLAVERKADASPVTAADREAEATIVRILEAEFPSYGVLGEEFGSRGNDRVRWIVDPLDGTKSFVRGLPFFATLLALEREGEVVLGVVHEAVSGETYYAVRGEGAYGPRGRLAVSRRSRIEESMLVFGGLQAWQKAGRWDALGRLVARSVRQRAYGDYLGHLCVARGQAEAMLELDLKPWDMAAVKILVEEAGGRFTDLDGHPTIYGSGGVSSNGLVHDEVLRLLRGEIETGSG
ncbi:MAG: histidinol phosphate phosphatase [Candidatus Binatia bacterium]|nr:MAG: histidinol phosphate phosphatase [Candidatus Binatia bacterium]